MREARALHRSSMMPGARTASSRAQAGIALRVARAQHSKSSWTPPRAAKGRRRYFVNLNRGHDARRPHREEGRVLRLSRPKE